MEAGLAPDLGLLVNLVCQVADDGIDFAAQGCESSHYRECDQRGGNGILGEFKTSFISQKASNHWMLLVLRKGGALYRAFRFSALSFPAVVCS